MNSIYMKPILIAGLGSAGRRHFRNLREIGHKNFILYRTGKSTLLDDEIKDIPTEYNLNKALAHNPAATIISNPTSLHMNIALAAAKAGSHLFIEKPVSNTMAGIKQLEKIVKQRDLIVQVGFQFRFHPLLLKIKRLLERKIIGQVVSVQAHWGEYLPKWHPGEDYRQSYSARKQLGGGVILTLSHPLDYLRWIFGEVESVSAFEGKTGGLEIDVEDTADILLKFKSGVIGNVHLDYIERPGVHFIHIIGQEGIIHEQLNLNEFDRNKLFFDEMAHFLSSINNNEQPLCTLNDGITALKIALAAKESAKKENAIKL